MPGCQHIWATDYRWWRFHRKEVNEKYAGQCWTQEVQWPADQNPAEWGIKCLRADTSAAGLSTDPDVVHTGRNSGYAAINLALHLGAERILLLGYDMKMRGNDRHWFGAHPKGMDVQSDYALFATQFRTILPSKYGIEIWNVTRDTALACFPCYDLDEVCAVLS